jgi:HD-like signal output (HDOD) protein
VGEEPHRALVEDAVEDLYAAGLIHRLGHLVCATRAAHEAQRLAG